MTRPTISALFLAFVAPAAGAQQGVPIFAPAPPQVVATGHGESKIASDRATIHVAVETRAKTAADAGRINARKLQAVQDTLTKLGVQRDQMATVQYSVTPDWRWEERTQRLIGYVASNTLRIQIRKLETVGQLIDASLGAGANNINSVEFTASMIDSARRVAIREAVTQARADAEAMARAAGGSLGQLIEVNTQDMGPRPMMQQTYMRAAKAEAADVQTPITPGEQTVTAMVHARWQFIASGR